MNPATAPRNLVICCDGMRKPPGTRASYAATTWLLAGFTMIKLLALITIGCLLCWLAVYLLTNKKQKALSCASLN